MLKPKPSGTTEVLEFLQQLEHHLLAEIRELRRIILNADQSLTEHIKWKGPSFCADGDDRITMKLFPPKNIQLIFHRGVKVKQQPDKKLIEDTSGMLIWAANDRAVATFTNLADIQTKEALLTEIVTKWIKAAKA